MGKRNGHVGETGSMAEYYCTNAFQVTWRELWRNSRTLRIFLVAAILKLSGTRRKPVNPTCGFARDALQFIEPGAIPDDVALQFRALSDAFIPLGFKPCLWSTVLSIGPTQGFSETMLNDSGTIYASANWVKVVKGQIRSERLVFAVVSKLNDNTILGTSNEKRKLDVPAGFRRLHLPGKSVREVLIAHQERLAQLPLGCVVRLDVNSLRETMLDVSKRFQEFQISRGVLVKLSDDQVAAITSRTNSQV
jgi:hypothetical protein